MQSKQAIVLLSGGLDSATILAIARHEGYDCHTLAFDYGQRHRSELLASKYLAKFMNSKTHRVMKINMQSIGGSALTDNSIEVPTSGVGKKIPITYVPARNTIFLSYGLALAEVVKADSIFIGVNSVDYSGYPDCRLEYIKAFEKMSNLATKMAVEGRKIQIKTPLINLNKKEIIKKGIELKVDYSKTISCYQADSEGKACRLCDSCRLRKQGFKELGVTDPTIYR